MTVAGDEARVKRVAGLAGGNPGAIVVMCLGIKEFGDGFLDLIEGAGLRGSQIWIAFKDICGQDIKEMQAGLVLRQAKREEVIDWQF